MLTGRCLCEGVAYEIEGELGPAYNCHCSKCRRWHGAAFRSRASIRTEQFRWVRGEELLASYLLGKVTRLFCKVCGSNVVSTYADRPEVLGLPLGGLEQHPGRVPEAHIFVGSKSPWYEITDDLPRFEAWPGEERKVRETR
ncbi:MAG: GFA family protein [Myxococcales bacterium]|nr:MAG: GFA family protein [Myxococcales bacterium]